MATTGYKSNKPTWDLSADEEKRFKQKQSRRIVNDESKIRSLIDDTQDKQKSISDALSVDGWTDSDSRVKLQKNIYSYQNNLAKLKSYGYDTTYQSEFGRTANEIAGARSQYYSRFKTKGDYDNYEIGERLKKNLKGATYDDIQNQITETQDTINRLRHNGGSSKLLTENARKLNILKNWTNYESVNDFEKALKNVENLQNTASSEFAGANIDLQTAAGDEEYKQYSRESDAATNWMNNLKAFQVKLEKGKEDLEFSNKAQEYAKRLSGDEVRAIREYNNLYDKGVNNTLSLVAQGISSGGTSDNGAVDNGLTVKENNRKIEIENYFKNRGMDLKTVSDIYRSVDNKKIQEEKLAKVRDDMDSSKLMSAIYSLSNPFVSASGGIPALVGNIIYGDDVKYNAFNVLNKASEVITQETKQDITDMLLKNDNLTLAPGMLNKKGEFLNSLIGGAYDLYNTMAESAIARVPAMVTGVSFLTDALFGLNAFTNTYNEMIDSGADKGKALATGALAGVFEGLFEHVSLEKLKTFQTSSSVTVKDFVKNSLKQFVTEGSEELFTDFANTISDQLINGDASELSKRMQDLVASGSTYNEALSQVAKEYAAQEIDTFVIGGLSGAVSGAGYTGLAAINNAGTGKNINTNGQRSALLSDAETLAESSYDSALRAAYESVSRDEENSRKGIGANLRTGNLYNLSRNQAYGNAIEAQRDEVKKSVNDFLVTIGTDEKKADILSDTLSKTAAGEGLTKTEKKLVKALKSTSSIIDNLNNAGKKVYGEITNEIYNGNSEGMTADGIAARLVQSAGLSVRQAQSFANDIINGNDRLALNYDYIAEIYNSGRISDEESRAKTEKAYDTLERLDKYALGMSSKSTVVERTDGDNEPPAEIKKINDIDKKNGVMTVELSDGKNAQVSLTSENSSDIDFANDRDEYVYTAAGTLFNTTEDANSFILASKNTDLPVTDFVHEFEAVVNNGRAGNAIGRTKLSAEVAEIAYGIGLNSGDNAYRTFESGTKIKGNKDMSKLDVDGLGYGFTNMATTNGKHSRSEIEIVARTLDAYGKKNNIKYVFVDSIKSAEGKNASGTYSAGDNVIYLSATAESPLSVAAAHETFHFLKANNRQAGNELQEYIINKLKADSSYDYDARVEELSRLYGTDDIDAVNEEIAANAMFDLFDDEKTLKDLAKNHRKLFDIVKEKLEEIIDYFKNAVKKYADFLGNKEAKSNLRNDYEALKGIRDKMNKALEEVKDGESEKTESAAGGEKAEHADAVSSDNNADIKNSEEQRFAEKFSLDENEEIVNKYNKVLAENKHLRRLNEMLEAEMKKTPRKEIGKKGRLVLNDVVKHIIKKYESSANSEYVAERIAEILNYAKKNNIDMDSVTQAVAVEADEIARLSKVVIFDDDLYEDRQSLKAYLRKTPIRLSDETKRFLAEEYGSYDKFRRKYFSKIRFTSDINAMTLDSMWDDLVNSYPGIFTPEDLEEDSLHQPLVLASAIEQDGNLYLYDMGKGDREDFAVAMATEILKDFTVKSPTKMDKLDAENSKIELLKEETQRTSRHVTNKGRESINKIAENIVEDHKLEHIKNAKKRISAEILRICEANDNDPSVYQLMKPAKEIVKRSGQLVSRRDATTNERLRLRGYVQSHPIALGEEAFLEYSQTEFNDAENMESYFEPFSDNGGKLADEYKELKKEFPTLFAANNVQSEIDMMKDFMTAFTGDYHFSEEIRLKDLRGRDIDMAAYEVALNIKSEYEKRAATYADKMAKKVQETFEKGRKLLIENRAKYERKMIDERANLYGLVNEAKDIRYDLETRRYYRTQARKNVRALSNKLLNPTKNQYIPAELRGAVAGFLKEFTYDSLMFKNDSLADLQQRYDAVIVNNATTALSIDDPYITDALAQIKTLTESLNETFGKDKRNFRKIGWVKMKAINEYVKALSHLVNNYNTVTIDGKKVDMYETAHNMVKELPRSKEQIKSLAKMNDLYDRLIKYGNMTPYYFFKRTGGTMERLYKDLYSGEMQAAKEGLKAKQKLESIYDEYNAKNWILDKNERDYTTERGEKFQLTTNQRLYLYAAIRTMIEDQRQQENGSITPLQKLDAEIPHIMQGGIVFMDDMRTEKRSVNDKLKIKATYEYKDKTPIRLTEGDISKIFDDMPNEQKSFVDEIVKYMSGDLAKLGNEASVRLYGYEKFTKGYYFPIHSAQYYIRRADNSEQGQERSTSPLIKNKGMTKERKEGANNPVVVENFTDVMTSHITDMINFRYLAEPQFNLFRVMNYNAKAVEPVLTDSGESTESTDVKMPEMREAVNVRTSFDNAYGHEYTRYIDNLIHDISSGATLDEVESVTAKALSRFKKLATAANLSVVVQQPTAIMRAMALVDPKYFINKPSWNKSYDEAMRYAGTAILKDIGGYGMYNNTSMADWLTDFESTAKDKIKAFMPVDITADDNGKKTARMSWNDEDKRSIRDDAFGFGAEKADAVTWGVIWEAVKKETADKNGLTGEALLTEAGKRFDEVVEATQVYDSTLSRSQFMRANSTIAKTVTAFMAEPTKTFNMLMDANYERWIKKSKGSYKYLGRATAAIFAANLLNAFVRSLVTALRRDPDKSYLEQYTKEVVENFADGSSIINMLPIIKDIVSIMQGEDLTRSDLEPIADMYDAVTGAFKDNADVWDKANGVLVPAGVLTSVPLRNISRDLKALLNVFDYAEKNTTEEGMKFALKEALNSVVSGMTFNIIDEAFENDNYDKLFKYYDKSDAVRSEQQYEEIKAYLIWSGKTEDKAEDVIENEIKAHILEKYPEIVEAASAHINGNLSTYANKMNIVTEKYDEDLVKAVEKNIESKLKRASAAKGDNDTDGYNKLIDELTGYGYDKDTLERDIDKVKSSSSSSSSSDGYDSIYNKADAVRAYVSGNMTLYEQIKNDMELDGSKIKTALNELYSAGEVTDEQYTDMYIAVLAPGKTTKTVTDVNEAKKNEAFFALEAQQAKKDGEEYSKYTDINTAMENFVSGKETGLKVFNAEVKKLEEHGVAKSTIKSNITTQYKDKVCELYKTNKSEYINLRAKIVAMCGQLGYSTEESVKYLDNWVKDLK